MKGRRYCPFRIEGSYRERVRVDRRSRQILSVHSVTPSQVDAREVAVDERIGRSFHHWVVGEGARDGRNHH